MQLLPRKTRLAYLVTHPIQYQAPLFRRIAAEPDIDLTVFFCSDISTKRFVDTGFGMSIEWDIPLLEGYRHEFVPAVGRTDRLSFWRPFNYGIHRRLRAGRFDALWVHGYMRWFNWSAMVAAKSLGMRVLVRDEATEFSRERGLIRQWTKWILFAVLRRVVDGWLAIGRANAEYYRRLGVAERRIFSVPYTVDNRFFRESCRAASARREELRRELGLAAGRPVILFASKLQPRKRALDLLEAYRLLSPDGVREPHPYLLFIGDGEQRSALEDAIRRTGWGSIHFLGFKNQTELPRYYDLCDVFVLPSVHEPWGLVVNEAMNAGRAVVVSDQVGCGPDLVHEGCNGYVFRAGDIADLTRALREAVEDRQKCRALGRESLNIINTWGFDEDIAGLKKALARNG